MSIDEIKNEMAFAAKYGTLSLSARETWKAVEHLAARVEAHEELLSSIVDYLYASGKRIGLESREIHKIPVHIEPKKPELGKE